MTYLDNTRWEWVQRVLPIAVIDILAVEGDAADSRIGLIRRSTPHQGERWNLVGGRIQYGETIGDAIKRELRDALGGAVAVDVTDDEQPAYLAQYGPWQRPPFSLDPRKHAVGLTFVLPIDGVVDPQGEARDFAWFPPHRLPTPAKWGFEQDRVAAAALRSVGRSFEFDDS